MRLNDKVVGLALTGSHCTVEEVFAVVEKILAAGATIIPIVSHSFTGGTSTRFGDPAQWLRRLEEMTGHRPLQGMAEVEPIGPQKLLDILAIIPCTGNTLAKLANAITDTPVTFAAKAQMRNLRPVVLGITSNDCLGLGAKNLGLLLAAKNVFFIPFGQPNSTKGKLIARRLKIIYTGATYSLGFYGGI